MSSPSLAGSPSTQSWSAQAGRPWDVGPDVAIGSIESFSVKVGKVLGLLAEMVSGTFSQPPLASPLHISQLAPGKGEWLTTCKF